MPQRRRLPNPRPLLMAERAIRRSQKQDALLLRNAVVGRSITQLPGEGVVNGAIARESATYTRLGHIALVYIFPREFRASYGTTFHNSLQVQIAIDKLGAAATCSLRVARRELDMVERNSKRGSNEPRTYWVRATAGPAYYEDSSQVRQANLAHEELAISNALFEENMDITGSQQLWLGALCAPNADAARDALDIMEDIIPGQLPTGPVQIISTTRSR